MKHYLKITLLILYCNISLGQSKFIASYGDLVGSDFASSIIQTNDGNYVFTGYTTYSNPTGVICIVKINNIGDTLWTKLIGDTIRFRNSLFIEQLRDSGFIISAYTTTPNGEDDIYLIRTDSLGNTLWTKKYGYSSNEDIIYSIHQTLDNNFIATGYSYQSDGSGGCCGKGLLMKLNSVGDTIWTKTIMSTLYDWFSDVKETNDSNYIVTGVTDDTANFGHSYASLLKFSPNGTLLWHKMFSISRFARTDNIEISSNGYVISGSSESDTSHFLFLLKTDFLGNLVWCKTYHTPYYDDSKFVLTKAGNDGFLLLSNYYDSLYSNSRALLIKTDLSGDTLWTNSFSGINTQCTGNSISFTTDGGAIIAGTTSYNSSTDIYIIKTDSSGSTGCYEKSPSVFVGTYSPQTLSIPFTISSGLTESFIGTTFKSGGNTSIACLSNSIKGTNLINESFELYPNPSDGNLTILLNHFISNASISIFNILGEEIYFENLPKVFSGKKKINLNASSGIYFVKVEGTGKQFTKKLILE